MHRRDSLRCASAAALATGTASALWATGEPPRIAYGGMSIECSTCSHIRARTEDFTILRGAEADRSPRFRFLSQHYPGIPYANARRIGGARRSQASVGPATRAEQDTRRSGRLHARRPCLGRRAALRRLRHRHRNQPCERERVARNLAEQYWNACKQFAFGTEVCSLDDCVRKAIASSTSSMVLADSGDNPNADGNGDQASVLAALLKAGAKGVVFGGIADRPAVEACYRVAGHARRRACLSLVRTWLH